ncbi:hypothetical protein OG218_09760 [Kineococcus sp. NBC_00420]|uniref:hypothetical protein n=1 Tax=Kineococcus sp. NBC_00420 TaxID=2903564 RepID=UPI002E242B2C
MDLFTSLSGGFLLVLGVVLLATADDAGSVTSSLTSILLGLAVVLIAPGRSRPWVKAVGIAAVVVEIALVVYQFTGF